MPSSFAVSWRSFSMSSPFLPITMPGRAVWMVMFTFFAARSIWMRLTEASFRRVRQELAHAEIRVHVQRELLLAGIPLRHPVAGDAEANAKRINFLTHALNPSCRR